MSAVTHIPINWPKGDEGDAEFQNEVRYLKRSFEERLEPIQKKQLSKGILGWDISARAHYYDEEDALVSETKDQLERLSSNFKIRDEERRTPTTPPSGKISNITFKRQSGDDKEEFEFMINGRYEGWMHAKHSIGIWANLYAIADNEHIDLNDAVAVKNFVNYINLNKKNILYAKKHFDPSPILTSSGLRVRSTNGTRLKIIGPDQWKREITKMKS